MNKWISCKERLPLLKQRVLVWNGEDQFVAWRERESEDSQNDWEYSCCGCYCGIVTHWVPLPEPPK